MNTQQMEHWRALAASHKDTPGDLAAAYRVIGELLDEKGAKQQRLNDLEAFVKFLTDNYNWLAIEIDCTFPGAYGVRRELDKLK